MIINDKNIKFTFYLNENKYVVYTLNEYPNIGDDLFFAKEIKGETIYENIPDNEYQWVLEEYKDYLSCIEESDDNEN